MDVSQIFDPGPSNTGMPKLFPLEGQNCGGQGGSRAKTKHLLCSIVVNCIVLYCIQMQNGIKIPNYLN